MAFKHILTRVEYEAAMKRIEELIVQNPQEGSPTFEELDHLGTLVSTYEDLHFPIEVQ